MLDKIYDIKNRKVYIIEYENGEIQAYNYSNDKEKWQGDERVASLLLEVEHKPGSPLFKNEHHVRRYIDMLKTIQGGKTQ